MNPFTGFDSSVYGSNKFYDIKKENSNDIGNVVTADFLICKNDGNGPPKSKTIHK